MATISFGTTVDGVTVWGPEVPCVVRVVPAVGDVAETLCPDVVLPDGSEDMRSWDAPPVRLSRGLLGE